MRVLLQRVRQASVSVDDRLVASIGPGWLILYGVGQEDTPADAVALARRVVDLRCFPDSDGRTNLSALDVSAELLVVSQFTLFADLRRGRRPSFTGAGAPELARALGDQFAAALRDSGLRVEEGRFGAHMLVSLVNDGPFTLWLDSRA